MSDTDKDALQPASDHAAFDGWDASSAARPRDPARVLMQAGTIAAMLSEVLATGRVKRGRGRERCAGCGVGVGPGRAGRRCEACRVVVSPGE
jgi:hypothetical protein